ncbi:hypothetical protein OCK02_05310 (plasmid) [Rhizobium sp. TRM96647]|uniref:hypothetical protein n=1 Tax=unclassified Rhizobium TaxID=2613769 RepID=UPI0021E7639F|nr:MULTISPECIES: hypothetical protein [unclassified Rhizobium]MCV3735616.1 hypothetical protein [Rhizobium sp. TRM96647]MCV3757621.1 hypothetical protein [Rhizobium sp. TRM96650]
MTEETRSAENYPGRRSPRTTAAANWTAGWRLAFRSNKPNEFVTGELRAALGEGLPVPTGFGIPMSRRNLSEA